MRRHGWSSQSLLWAIVCTLVLKAGVPLFAATAAHLQGLPVGTICSLYGVTLPGAKADRAAHAHHQGHHGPEAPADEAPSHSGADSPHCALTGLAAMAAWQLVPPATHAAAEVAPQRRSLASSCAADACAAWAARLQHPPPPHARTAAPLG